MNKFLKHQSFKGLETSIKEWDFDVMVNKEAAVVKEIHQFVVAVVHLAEVDDVVLQVDF